MKRLLYFSIALLLLLTTCKEETVEDIQVYIASGDYHTHLRSPDATVMFVRMLEYFGMPVSAEDSVVWDADLLIQEMDVVGIKKASILSVAYMFSYPEIPLADELEKVRAENDWVAQEVNKYPDRLFGLCGVNPLRDYAVDEIRRCALIPGIQGLKMHFTNSDVDVSNPVHVAKLKMVFAEANTAGIPILVHLRKRGVQYGYDDVNNFIDEVLPYAPDVIVQIAHMGGWGGYDPQTESAMKAFVEAKNNGKLGSNVYFDIAYVVPLHDDTWEMGESNMTPEESAEWQLVAGQKYAERMRQIGFDKILFGTDWRMQKHDAAVKVLSVKVPLTDDELKTIMGNIAPYFEQITQ